MSLITSSKFWAVGEYSFYRLEYRVGDGSSRTVTIKTRHGHAIAVSFCNGEATTLQWTSPNPRPEWVDLLFSLIRGYYSK